MKERSIKTYLTEAPYNPDPEWSWADTKGAASLYKALKALSPEEMSRVKEIMLDEKDEDERIDEFYVGTSLHELMTKLTSARDYLARQADVTSPYFKEVIDRAISGVDGLIEQIGSDARIIRAATEAMNLGIKDPEKVISVSLAKARKLANRT